MHTHITVGRAIKKLREARNYTQQFVAEQLQMSQTSYSNMERGKTEISLRRLEQISSLFQISLYELLACTQPPKHLSDHERTFYQEQIVSLQRELASLRSKV
ncbi:Helix-turn-helix [Flexibacter flexilis DSM 6793]|uniref:Helix-turn-helix n=1 Tax=Flexibacter flexilis DSM 6793 TaxID=927664 RepID=A0A1I1EGF6_9BACT|nr:helix-turn-helix transcriptional regulator [Flexibacter flexilis]SFB85796.1 Helix-turn-helix [Flexibacter flexilis DSM 6793]